MAAYKLSREAEHDLEGIYYIGFVDFGPLQADAYYEGLVERFQHIADSPLIYPDVSHIRKGYRRSVYHAHSIYYRIESDSILIVRIIKKQDISGI
ncbi:MAG: type II toxin-antitoxin system RelE/ParE family toxin [Candidatus Thiodiazotropha sp.]|jgi:toxin ParE1/3/4